MLMKGESDRSSRRAARADPETVGVAVLGRLADDPERLGRFLALTGLDPASIRSVAGTPAFLCAVLDHVLGDESLLLAVADEAGLDPASIGRARQAMAPDPDP